MKKLSAILLLSALSLTIAGCKKEDDNQYVLKMGIVTSANHTHNKAIEKWAETVKKDTDGRLEIKLLGSGQLGGERSYIESMQLGSLDMAQVSSSVISNFKPDFNVMSLPYVFDSYESIDKIVTSEVGEKLFAQLDTINLVGLTWFSNGFRSVFANKAGVTKPEDLNGLKIRVMENSVMIDTLNAMGASATPMAYGELYTALQQGLLQGAENAPGNILNDKFYEVSKQLILTEHFATPGVVLISKKSYNKLPEDLQSYLKKSALELGVMERAMDKEAQEKAVEQLKSHGVTVTEVDKDAFKATTVDIYKEVFDDVSDEIVQPLKKELNLDF